MQPTAHNRTAGADPGRNPAESEAARKLRALVAAMARLAAREQIELQTAETVKQSTEAATDGG